MNAKSCLLATLFWVVLTSHLSAQDRTESPYFFIPNAGTKLESFPLLHTEATVDIAGVIADVKVTQFYQNSGEKPIEAIYVFPASTRAAVYHMQMTIGERTIRAVVRERESARQMYDQAKEEGKSASLLEQHRPNVFQMNVANIMPGDTIQVELFYTELLVPEEGVYEFVYPTVVGPRYTSPGESTPVASTRQWVANPYLLKGTSVPYTFDIGLKIRAGIPLWDINCPSHEVHVKFKDKNSAQIALKETERDRGNKDFIVRYRLRGNKVEHGVLLYEGKDENFFLLMMQPPERPEAAAIPPREYIFLLDVSGSMSGFPLDISKGMMRELLDRLRPSDKFNIMTFAGAAGLLAERSIPASKENIERAMQSVLQLQGGGGTEMLSAIRQAMRLQKEDGFARSFVILTDGFISMEASVFDYISNNLDQANFFAFGIGRGVNRFLIEGIAHAGASDPFVVVDTQEAQSMAERFRKYVETPVLTNLSLSYEGLEVYDVTPARIPDLMGERPVIVFGKYRGQAQGKLLVSGQNAKGRFSASLPVSRQEAREDNRALRYLWARDRLRTLADYAALDCNNSDPKEEIIRLGLQYNLLTAYTSFVAIDERIRNTTGKREMVVQPLPLPEGVENSAVGWGPPAAPPMPPPPPPEPAVEEVFKAVEEMPRFPGCEELTGNTAEKKACADEKMMKFIYDNLQYPAMARENSIEGTVVVSFTVGKDGQIRDIQLVRDIGGGCAQEALRIIQLMIERGIRWIPGKQRGRPVSVQYQLPVRFRLER